MTLSISCLENHGSAVRRRASPQKDTDGEAARGGVARRGLARCWRRLKAPAGLPEARTTAPLPERYHVLFVRFVLSLSFIYFKTTGIFVLWGATVTLDVFLLSLWSNPGLACRCFRQSGNGSEPHIATIYYSSFHFLSHYHHLTLYYPNVTLHPKPYITPPW